MRLKITKPLSGSIDGLNVGRFKAGEIYEIGTSLANYLLAIDAAEPVSDPELPDAFPNTRHEPAIAPVVRAHGGSRRRSSSGRGRPRGGNG